MARLGTGAIVLALATLTGCGNRWDDYRWATSSAAFGLPQLGTLGQRGHHELLFHTAEEDKPWVIVDMLEDRSIRRIAIQNRLECCQTRGLPMTVELRSETGNYVQVARRTTPFDTWEVGIVPGRVRYLRIAAESRTYLHLRAIEVE